MSRSKQQGVAPFDVKEGWAWRLRWACNWLVVAAVLIALVDSFGLPHLAWDYWCHGRPVELGRAYRAVYVGPLGRVTIDRDEHGRGMTAIKWVGFEPPLHRRLLNGAINTVEQVTGRLFDHSNEQGLEPWETPL